jgi:CheY-like chemotaxis protein
MKAIIVDDDAAYRRRMKTELQSIGYEVSETNEDEVAKRESGADFIILDDYKLDHTSYWRALLGSMRARNPDATVLLVSGYSDDDLAKHVNELQGVARELLRTDPFVQFLPKTPNQQEGNDRHYKRVTVFAQDLQNHVGDRAALQETLIECAFDAARRLRVSKLGELRERVEIGGKKDTLKMDIIAEKCIAEHFAPEMHFKSVMICTEEAGLHNRLYHRIQKPAFFIFSDPFDGSTAFKALVEELLGGDHNDHFFGGAQIAKEAVISCESTLSDLASCPAIIGAWDKVMGWHGLNAPMVSVVLAERHRVAAAVLVNLFTLDVYVSLTTGNFWKPCLQLSDHDMQSLRNAINGNGRPHGWNRLEFRSYREVQSSRLFLGTMSAVKKSKKPPETTCFNAHGETCLSPIMRGFLDWEGSFAYRLKQHDFTPGPGRVLFLTNAPVVDEYEKRSLDGNRYRCILSIGEPFTEWIGWFAFLSHAPGIAGYCLRRKGEAAGHCEHRRDVSDPSTLLPHELGSIFREGHIDVGLLPTAYGERMRRYNDTLVIYFEGDEERQRVTRADGQDLCVRVPLFNW